MARPRVNTWELAAQQRVLVHDINKGQPCYRCGDQCPGFELHVWRRRCKYCGCPRDEHGVNPIAQQKMDVQKLQFIEEVPEGFDSTGYSYDYEKEKADPLLAARSGPRPATPPKDFKLDEDLYEDILSMSARAAKMTIDAENSLYSRADDHDPADDELPPPPRAVVELHANSDYASYSKLDSSTREAVPPRPPKTGSVQSSGMQPSSVSAADKRPPPPPPTGDSSSLGPAGQEQVIAKPGSAPYQPLEERPPPRPPMADPAPPPSYESHSDAGGGPVPNEPDLVPHPTIFGYFLDRHGFTVDASGRPVQTMPIYETAEEATGIQPGTGAQQLPMQGYPGTGMVPGMGMGYMPPLAPPPHVVSLGFSMHDYADFRCFALLHFGVDRLAAEAILKRNAAVLGEPRAVGLYLLRPSNKAPSTVVISVYGAGAKVMHYQFTQRQGVFYNGKGNAFGGLASLIDHFTRHSDGMICRLTQCLGPVVI